MGTTDRSIIDVEHLKRLICAEYGIDDRASFEFWRTGIAGNDTYVVTTNTCKYFLKVYFHRMENDQIESSVCVMEYLESLEIKVPKVFGNKRGCKTTQLSYPEGSRLAVLFEFIEGEEPSLKDDGVAIGRFVGRMYEALDAYRGKPPVRKIDRDLLVDRAMRLIRKYRPGESGKIDDLENMGNTILLELERHLSRSEPQFGICHGDLHTGNMIKDRNGDIYVFDFDSCGYGFRIYDIGIHANDNWAAKTRDDLQADMAAFELFRAGFEETRSMSSEEKGLFPYMLGLRHLELFGLVLENCVVLEGRHWIRGSLDFHHGWFGEWKGNVISDRKPLF